MRNKYSPKDICVGEDMYADLSPVIGNEIGGLRPVLIKEVHDDVVIVVPYVLNYKTGKREPHPYQVRAIDYSRLRSKIQEKEPQVETK